jgi:hypothetical protein
MFGFMTSATPSPATPFSNAVAAGDSLFIVGKLLGHARPETTNRYAHLAPDPAQAAANRTGERLHALLSGAPPAAVVPLRKNAG